jgi:transposase-like protein
MAYLGEHCRYCSSEKVDSYPTPSGIFIYECDACGRVWNSKNSKKIS